MKKRYLFLGLIACIYISNKICSEGLENSVALLVENNFYLPKETCICTFRKTVNSEGSGEGWTYGEDNKYYYSIDSGKEFVIEKVEITTSFDYISSYYILKKDANSEILEKLDYATIMYKNIYERGMEKELQEDNSRIAEQIREVFRRHGKGVKCRAGRSKWLGGC
jgi:hypothetical protein